MQKLVDLHTHTTASDGCLNPKAFIEMCKKENVCAVAITDHDTTDAVDECTFWGNQNEIEVISGIEIACKFPAELHMLGLFLDIKNKNLISACQKLKDFRTERNLKMIKNLSEQFNISPNDFQESNNLTDISSLGRVHMANTLLQKGFVCSVSQAFEKYLSKGTSTYAEREKPTIKESIDIIHSSGGLAFLAHPNHSAKDLNDLDSLLKILKSYGIDGVETYHSSMNVRYSKHTEKLCQKYNLLISAGSDFHGIFKTNVRLGKTFENRPIPYSILENIKVHTK